MHSSCERSISRNTTWSAIHISLKRNIPKFDTVLLHSDWSSLRRKYLCKIPTDVNALSCGPKTWKNFGNFGRHFPALHPQKSSQHVRACAAGDGAICSKNRTRLASDLQAFRSSFNRSLNRSRLYGRDDA